MKFRYNGSSLPAVSCKKGVLRNLAQVFPCEFCEISKKTFSYRTPPVAASGINGVNGVTVDFEQPSRNAISFKYNSDKNKLIL